MTGNMKEIRLKEMCFVNFKGLQDLKVSFNGAVSTISGHNASGKTSIFDGFTWLLFGKDSQDRKAFDIKTIDNNGKVIPKIPHEVSAILSVNGEEVKLCRRFNEKWVKRRGQSEEEFTGHEEERLYNDVPMSLKEWNEKIASLCSEQVFKMITNPVYFVSQKTDVQRAMLFRMAGHISDEDIASNDPDFKELLASLTGKTMEEYKKEVQAKKRRIKENIEAIPDRIDERKRDITALSCDFDSIEKELEAKQAELSTLEEQLLDASKKEQAVTQRRVALTMEMSKLAEDRIKYEREVKEKCNNIYQMQVDAHTTIMNDINSKELQINNLTHNINEYEVEKNKCNTYREKLIDEWKEINSQKITFKEGDFICPTCKRPLDTEDIERKQAEMVENFNLTKSARLEENLKKGRDNKTRMTQLTDSCDELKSKLEQLQEELRLLKEQLDEIQIPEKIDLHKVLENDDKYKELSSLITAKQEELNADYSKEKVDNHGEQKSIISQIKVDIDRLKKTLNNKEIINNNNERIAELEKLYRTGSQEIADLEKIEFVIADFNKARIEAVESKINGMFKMVKFKIFEQQINGGEMETCEAMADGKPYSTQNKALQVNMGLDIINAICNFEGVTAPIFIDNCESIEDVLETQSQQIRMYVANNPLTIK